MSFFDTVQQFLNIVWSNVEDFPILNTGLVFKNFFFGFLGLSVLGFLLSKFFGFSPVSPRYGVGFRSRHESISESRRNDER